MNLRCSSRLVRRFVEEGARVVFGDLLNEKGKRLEEELGKNATSYWADATSPSARIAQKISLVRTRSQCDTGVIQDGFIRRYSMALERGVFVCGEGVSPSIFRMKGPFDFILSREGLRERSNPLIPQGQRP